MSSIQMNLYLGARYLDVLCNLKTGLSQSFLLFSKNNFAKICFFQIKKIAYYGFIINLNYRLT